MIYDFGSHGYIYKHLMEKLPRESIKAISKTVKLEKLAKEGDLVIFYGWGKGHRKCQRMLLDRGVRVEVDGKTSLKLGDKIWQLQVVDKMTKYPLERVFKENQERKYEQIVVPKLESSDRVVVKVGNAHQGEGKYLKEPNTKLMMSKESVIFEQFVDNARSIRVLFIGDTLFIVEHKSREWIKNMNPEELTYSYNARYQLGIHNIDEIIGDALNLKKHFGMSYGGIDYVVSEDVTGLLEVNDMVGLPEVEEVREVAKDYWLALCQEHLEGVSERKG